MLFATDFYICSKRKVLSGRCWFPQLRYTFDPLPWCKISSQRMGKLWRAVCPIDSLAIFQLTGQNRPQNAKKLFNLVYARAQNVIEWIFGVKKKHYCIIVSSPEFLTETQAYLVCALVVTHSFICIYDPEDLPEPLKVIHNEHIEEDRIQKGISKTEQNRALVRRNKIAADMWAAYQGHHAYH